MPRESNVTIRNKIKIIEKYLSGKIRYVSAYRELGVTHTTFQRWLDRYKIEGKAGLLPRKKNIKYTNQIKLQAVMDYQNGQGSLREVSNKYSISNMSLLVDWLRVYNSHGEFRTNKGGSYMIKSRETTPSERIAIVKECIDNNNKYSESAKKHNVSYQQIRSWVKKYNTMGEAGLEDRRGKRAGTLPSRTPEEELRDRIAQLERKNLDLEMENALLKKVKELERRRR